MTGDRRIRQIWPLSMCILAVVAIGGCCGPMLMSHRFAPEEMPPDLACDVAGEECDICECRHVIDHFFAFARAPHELLPGAVTDHRRLIPLEPGEAARDVPHSKFHPVPVRPVFAPRENTRDVEPHDPRLAPIPVPEEISPDIELVPPEVTPSEPTPLRWEATPSETTPPPSEDLPPVVDEKPNGA